MDPAALSAEITGGPLAAGLAPLVAARDFNGVAAALNAPTERGPVPIAELSAYCVQNGLIGAFEATAWDAGTPFPVKALCLNVLSLLRDDWRLSTCDVDHPGFQAGCDAAVGGGLMTADQRAALMGMAANRVGRAAKLWGAPVTGSDCLTACGGD